MSIEFKPWEKMTRISPFLVTITEKIDGTNGCIVIEDGKIIAVQSRKRFITVDDDNYGFARWVSENEEDLLRLGDGHHFGEWAGLGIQKNPSRLERKHFFLFNSFRWADNPDKPDCCDVVPILFEGEMDNGTIPRILVAMQLDNESNGTKREGVCVYYPAFNKYTKHTIKSPNGKWCKD